MGSSIPAGIGCRQRGYSTAPSPFAMNADTLRDLAYLLADRFADYLHKLPQEPVYRPLRTEIRQSQQTMPIPRQRADSEGARCAA
jgi:hypothetical protein